jgi:hypothetical protein
MHTYLSVCQVMSVPTFRAMVLAMLVQKVETLEGGGRLVAWVPLGLVRWCRSSCLAKQREIYVVGG